MKSIKEILTDLVPKRGKNQSQVAKQLGISSQLLGQYIAGRQKPKPEFYLKWKEEFGDDLLNISKTNVSRETAQTADQEINLYQIKYISAIEEHNRFLQKILETNLNELSAGQRLIQAQVKAVHQWDAIQAAKGNKKKEQELMMQINRQIASNLTVNDSEGIHSREYKDGRG